MILGILKKRNSELKDDVNTLLDLLREAKVPSELQAYQELLIQICEGVVNSIDKNHVNINLNREELLEDILSDVQQSIMYVRMLSSIYVPPVLRASPVDRLSLSIVNWLQSNHPETHNHPPAVGDGNVSVWPTQPQLYMFPQLERRGLLYQPLLFHEFGHVLYVQHKVEMDNLVADLQRDISDLILPKSQRNDRHSEIQANRRQVVVDTWYSWIQELYCDAAGFQIGGPCYLYAFSSFLSIVDRNEYYRKQKDLELSDHPVTWLRIHFLADRARQAGLHELAKHIEGEWSSFARVLGIQEDYHGFYDKSLASVICQTIEDMLIEADPRKGSSKDWSGNGWEVGDSPVRLLNWAWQMKLQTDQPYLQWESNQIERFLKSKIIRVQLDHSAPNKNLALPLSYDERNKK